ncbi:hypothetical protein JCM8115_002057 [Rhodotorula mucilaginosa]|nr:hypothetical protein B0A53_00373 [Rhodotorula sp. CCFEE 5036]
MGGFVSTAAQVAAGALLPSLAALRAHHNAALDNDAPGSRRPSPAGAAAPSYTDVLDVLEILQQLHLPVELAIEILDAAEYYPAVTAQWTGNKVASAGPRGDLARATVLVTPPLPNIYAAPEHYVKRVSVWTDSRDQGFSSFVEFRGTRKGSSSWFNLVLLRPNTDRSEPTGGQSAEAAAPASPDSQQEALQPVATFRLHCNVHASHIFSQYISTLPRPPRPTPSPDDHGGETDPDHRDDDEDDGTAFLAQLRPGDRLAVVACAQYPMWVNAVRGCAIKVEMKVI